MNSVTNLVDAIISGKASAIETTFQAAIAEKINTTMADKKEELSQSMFKESLDAEKYEVDQDIDAQIKKDYKALSQLSTAALLDKHSGIQEGKYASGIDLFKSKKRIEHEKVEKDLDDEFMAAAKARSNAPRTPEQLQPKLWSHVQQFGKPTKDQHPAFRKMLADNPAYADELEFHHIHSKPEFEESSSSINEFGGKEKVILDILHKKYGKSKVNDCCLK